MERAKTARKGGTSGSDVRIARPREVQLENLPADHPAAQTARLRQLFGLIVLLALGFTLLSVVAVLAFHDAMVGITGAILFGFGCLVLVARSRLRQDNRREAVTMVCLGILGTTLIIMVLQPSWNATLAVTPLLTVGVALPYVGDRH